MFTLQLSLMPSICSAFLMMLRGGITAPLRAYSSSLLSKPLWHFLYFLPLWHQHKSFLPNLSINNDASFLTFLLHLPLVLYARPMSKIPEPLSIPDKKTSEGRQVIPCLLPGKVIWSVITVNYQHQQL